MYNVYWQEGNKIELTLSDDIDQDDFSQIIHQLESLSAMYQNIDVLIDAVNVSKYDVRIVLDEFDFYKQYKKHLNRVAIVSDNKFQKFFLDKFNKFSDTEFKTYEGDRLEEARDWIFPSRLP